MSTDHNTPSLDELERKRIYLHKSTIECIQTEADKNREAFSIVTEKLLRLALGITDK